MILTPMRPINKLRPTEPNFSTFFAVLCSFSPAFVRKCFFSLLSAKLGVEYWMIGWKRAKDGRTHTYNSENSAVFLSNEWVVERKKEWMRNMKIRLEFYLAKMCGLRAWTGQQTSYNRLNILVHYGLINYMQGARQQWKAKSQFSLGHRFFPFQRIPLVKLDERPQKPILVVVRSHFQADHEIY